MLWNTCVTTLVLILVMFGTRGNSARTSTGGRSRSSLGNRIRMYNGPMYTRSYWQTAAAAGTLYGLQGYTRRHLYLRNPDTEPTVCFNEDDLRNHTYGYFICPESDQPDNFVYCCGQAETQECCTDEQFSKQAVGVLVGASVGGVLVVGAVVLLICRYVCKIGSPLTHTLARLRGLAKTRDVKAKYTANPRKAVSLDVPPAASTTTVLK